nr:hypothetical protein [uncultured Prevotella sp.]
MKKIRKTVRQLYVRPTIDVVSVASEGSLLANSPLVRPGGGGTGSQIPGSIQVVPLDPDDNNPDDEIEG